MALQRNKGNPLETLLHLLENGEQPTALRIYIDGMGEENYTWEEAAPMLENATWKLLGDWENPDPGPRVIVWTNRRVLETDQERAGYPVQLDWLPISPDY
jgi:hypothetical protein